MQVTSHHSPKGLREHHPPSDLAGRNKSSTTLEVGRKTNSKWTNTGGTKNTLTPEEPEKNHHREGEA